MKSRLGLWLLIVVALVLCGALFLRRQFPSGNAPDKLEHALNNYVERGLLFDFTKEAPAGAESFVPIDQVEEAYYSNCIQLLQTKYGHDINFININEKVDPSRVNIYFFDKDPDGVLEMFRNNCTYTGYKNIIICDVKYVLEDLFHKKSFSDFTSSDEWGVIPTRTFAL